MCVAHGARSLGPPRRGRVVETDDIGVHLTLNAEHDAYRWGPLTHAPSLHSGEGGFPRSIDDLWEHADADEVYRELKAQIARAQAWGIDTTHLAPHLTAITLRPEFFGIYLELAAEFALPVRLPSTITEDQAGFPFRKLATDEGNPLPRPLRPRLASRFAERVTTALANLQPGVTELHIQPAIDTPEVRALTTNAEQWIDDLAFATDGSLEAALAASGATVIGYRDLRGHDARPVLAGGQAGESFVGSTQVQQSEDLAGVPSRFELAAHELDGRVEAVGRDHVDRRRDHDLGVVGPVDAFVVLADHESVLHAHELTSTGTPVNRSRSRSSPSSGDGTGPTSERARIQSSQG